MKERRKEKKGIINIRETRPCGKLVSVPRKKRKKNNATRTERWDFVCAPAFPATALSFAYLLFSVYVEQERR